MGEELQKLHPRTNGPNKQSYHRAAINEFARSERSFCTDVNQNGLNLR